MNRTVARLLHRPRPSAIAAIALLGVLGSTSGIAAGMGQAGAAPASATASSAQAPGAPFTSSQLTAMLPPSVYFAGRTASLQLRNAGGTKFANGAIVWVSLVDSSGYSSSVQDRYQFYLVTEGPLQFGDTLLKPGAYGGGYVGERFVLMDLGDHPVGGGPVHTDAELRRPRPLQIIADRPDAVRLYLGRRWVELQSKGK